MATVTTLTEIYADAPAPEHVEAGFSQVPACRAGQWGVLRRTPTGTDFIPTNSLDKAIDIVISPVVC